MTIMKSKKIFSVLLLSAIMFLMPIIPARAANTKDESFHIVLKGGEYYWQAGTDRKKTNNTPVYVCLDTAPYDFTYAQVWGTDEDGGGVNLTVGNVARVQTGVQSSIRSNIYEKGYKKCRLNLKAVTSVNVKAGDVFGVWSPDSSRIYTYAN